MRVSLHWLSCKAYRGAREMQLPKAGWLIHKIKGTPIVCESASAVTDESRSYAKQPISCNLHIVRRGGAARPLARAVGRRFKDAIPP
jgi:hypothetical protein